MENEPQVDRFVLEKVFPDPLSILTNISPRIAALSVDSAYVFDANTLLAPYNFECFRVFRRYLNRA